MGEDKTPSIGPGVVRGAEIQPSVPLALLSVCLPRAWPLGSACS